MSEIINLTPEDIRIAFYKYFKIAIQNDSDIQTDHCNGEFIHNTYKLFRSYRDEGIIKLYNNFIAHVYYDGNNNLYLIVVDEHNTKIVSGASRVTETDIFFEDDITTNRQSIAYLNDIINSVESWDTLTHWNKCQIKEAYEKLLSNFDILDDKRFLYRNLK